MLTTFQRILLLLAATAAVVIIFVVMVAEKKGFRPYPTSHYHRFKKLGRDDRTGTCHAIASATATANTVK